MSAYAVGSRIAAVRDATDDTIYLFGRGVYAGDFPRPGSGNWSESYRQMARNVVTESLAEDVRGLRAADDAFMVKRFNECVQAGTKTRQEADQDLAEYRRIRAEREAKRAAMSVEDQATELLKDMDLNPRLDLDGGGTVWGCECWWMSEEEFQAFRGARRVQIIPEPARAVL
jgi:hypothetical protein